MAKSETGTKRRPTDYSDTLANAICERLAHGKSIRTITASKTMPTYGRVAKWLREYPHFQQQYTRAREDQADWYAEQILDICQQAIDGLIDVHAARLMVDALKWTASKLKPGMYGDKVQVEHEVGDKLLDAINAANARLPASRRGPAAADPVERAIDVTPTD